MIRTLVHTEYFFESLHYCTITSLRFAIRFPSEKPKAPISSAHERQRAQSLNAR